MDILSSLNKFISLITLYMKRYIFLLLIALLLNTSCTNNKIIYPETDIIPVTESYYGDEILDNYRWLEDDMSDKTRDWVKRQNKTTFTYLNQIKFKIRFTDFEPTLKKHFTSSHLKIFIS